MKIFNSIESFRNIPKPVFTLGMYDGVHIGHQAIIRQLNEIAQKNGGESVLLTFNPHPRIALQKSEGLQFLTTLEEKMELLDKCGLQNIIVHPFSVEFSQLSAQDFVKELLVDKCGLDTLVVGYDHHFGKNREGNFEKLLTISKQFNFNLTQILEVKSSDSKVSSTEIRRALNEGNLTYATKALGRNYSLSGKVVHGDGIGKTLGFPTANLEVENYKLIPKDGVYAVKVFVDEKNYFGMLNIGNRPTISEGGEKRVEVNIFDFDKDIYNETLKIEFVKFLREDIKFPDIESLILQLHADKKETLKSFF